MNANIRKYINKKFIIFSLTSSLSVTTCTFSVIWFYLANIDRLDILYEAITVSSAVGIIFGFTLVSLFGFSAIIFTSSFLLCLIYKSYEKELKVYDGMTLSFLKICVCNSLVICIVLNGTFWLNYYFDISGYVVFGMTIFIVMFATYKLCHKFIFSIQNYIDIDNSRTKRYLQNKYFKILFPLLLISPAFMQVLPIIFIAKQLEFNEESNAAIQFFIFLLLSFLFNIIGLLPGSSIINEKNNKNPLQIIIGLLAVILVGVVVVSVFVRQTPNLIINMAMNLSGINDPRIHQYYINTNTHPHEMFDGALWNTRYYNEIDSRFFVTGVNIFSLGNIKLICPSNINAARAASLKTTPDSLDQYDARIYKLKQNAMNCVPFKKEEIQQWDSPISEPIFYQKVKTVSNSSILNLLQSIK